MENKWFIRSFWTLVGISESIGDIALHGTNDASVEEIKKVTLDINELQTFYLLSKKLGNFSSNLELFRCWWEN